MSTGELDSCDRQAAQGECGGSANQRVTRWRGMTDGAGVSSATAPSARTATAAIRTCRTPRPLPSCVPVGHGEAAHRVGGGRRGILPGPLRQLPYRDEELQAGVPKGDWRSRLEGRTMRHGTERVARTSDLNGC